MESPDYDEPDKPIKLIVLSHSDQSLILVSPWSQYYVISRNEQIYQMMYLVRSIHIPVLFKFFRHSNPTPNSHVIDQESGRTNECAAVGMLLSSH